MKGYQGNKTLTSKLTVYAEVVGSSTPDSIHGGRRVSIYCAEGDGSSTPNSIHGVHRVSLQ